MMLTKCYYVVYHVADTYRDKNGDTWFRISDGRWRIDCAGAPPRGRQKLSGRACSSQRQRKPKKKKIPSPQMNLMMGLRLHRLVLL